MQRAAERGEVNDHLGQPGRLVDVARDRRRLHAAARLPEQVQRPHRAARGERGQVRRPHRRRPGPAGQQEHGRAGPGAEPVHAHGAERRRHVVRDVRGQHGHRRVQGGGVVRPRLLVDEPADRHGALLRSRYVRTVVSRRREIAAALWRLAAREGLEAAGLAVAAEASAFLVRAVHDPVAPDQGAARTPVRARTPRPTRSATRSGAQRAPR